MQMGGYAREIAFDSLQQAVQSWETLLAANSTDLSTGPSKSLKTRFEELQQAILFARDLSQFQRVELYKRRLGRLLQ
jgi:hypothetical protein